MPIIKEHDWYKILGIKPPKPGEPAATQDEMKLAYRRALLANHPDKRRGSDSSQNTTPYSIDEITEAFRTLIDPALRLHYDNRVKLDWQGGADREVGKSQACIEIVDLDDLNYDVEKNAWYRGCRCGEVESFRVTEDGMYANRHQGEVITSCPGCSLYLKVTFVLNEDE